MDAVHVGATTIAMTIDLMAEDGPHAVGEDGALSACLSGIEEIWLGRGDDALAWDDGDTLIDAGGSYTIDPAIGAFVPLFSGQHGTDAMYGW